MNKKVLIVDDEVNILILMEQALEKLEDHQVTLLKARNGLEALEIIKKEEPALIFLDVMMPEMNGLEVCKIVKQDLKMDKTYIIMLTAKGQELDKQTGLAVGADCYMTKPFRPREVLAKSAEVLKIF